MKLGLVAALLTVSPVAAVAQMPSNLGAFAYADAGRVYVKGESPSGWHATSGLGLWFGVVNAATAIGAEVGLGGGLPGVRLRTGIIL